MIYAQSTGAVISGRYTSRIIYLIFNNVCLKLGLYTVLKPCLKSENTNISKNDLKFNFSKNILIFEWYDSFVQMLDNVYKARNGADVLILGDFNIDITKTTHMLGFYSCCLWTCSAHYFTHKNNAHFGVWMKCCLMSSDVS